LAISPAYSMLLFFQARSLQYCKVIAEATGPEPGFLRDRGALWKVELHQPPCHPLLRRFLAVPFLVGKQAALANVGSMIVFTSATNDRRKNDMKIVAAAANLLNILIR
jgi:hypothetical protein